MRRRIVATAVTLAVALAPLPAVALDVLVDFDETFPFDGLKTFGWLPDDRLPGRARTAENDALIKEEIESALTLRGYDQGSPPDFLVVYYVGLADQVAMERDDEGGTKFTPYEEGTLILEFYAIGVDLPIWRARAEEALDRPHLRKQVRKVLRKMLKSFPPHQ